MILSIVIPVYNVELYVERCLKSTQTQDISSSDYEVVVINDGSRDKSLDIVKRLAEQHSNIYVYTTENKGLSAARNFGIGHSNGDYIMFLDSDDWIAENCLGRVVRKLQSEKPDCLGICAANVLGTKIVRRFSYEPERSLMGRDHLSSDFTPCAPFSIWKREFLNQYNLRFCEGIFHEDQEFTPRAYYYAKKMTLINDIVYFVYQNPSSITRTINPKRSFDLVEHVAISLLNFSADVDMKYRAVFYNIINVSVNAALELICSCTKNDQLLLNNALYKNSKLYLSFSSSNKIKYKIEGILFRLFPRYPLKIYKILRKIY